MAEPEFLSLLNTIEFPRLYWELCERFPLEPTIVGFSGRKEDILAAFREMGVTPRCYSHGQSLACVCEEEQIGDIVWSGVFCKQRQGLELSFEGESQDVRLGSNFAGLAYDAKRFADPTFERNAFSGPSPYPRPDHNGDPTALKAIVKEFVVLVQRIKETLRSRIAG